ncbi:hypothetical protein BMF94_0417 [Rhodotorula taiwanensis]|uniref:DNA replication complex GINS protein SLD5 C-terminal domain-containing protein n=1 Tax=Rhodotorula taiwanensis TaxID=741276 RepID=A0A2S5BHI3_9BASI|nr:hypothetical protein BMF94_0417 [Rhodotorula taiwanensis]
MSRPARGFFDDDDDDDAQESFQTDRAVHGDADSLDHDSLNARGQSPLLPPLPAQYRDEYDRGSSVATGDRTHAGRVSSVTGAAMGSSVRGGVGTTMNGYDSMRGDSPSLDDIIAGGIGARKRGRNVQALLQAWQNEMGAPELLVFPVEIVERVVKDLARRKELVRKAQSTAGMDESFYLAATVVATENMRASHALKMFTRERIWKVGLGRVMRRARLAESAERRLTRLGEQLEQCPEYYLSQADVKHRLYPNEVAHAEGYVRLVKAYHDACAMDAMPAQVARQPPPMPTPDFSKPVFFRARKDCAPVVLPDGESFTFTAGSQHMCRYSTIRALLEAGDVELI